MGRGRTVSRGLYRRTRPIRFEYETTPNDTLRLSAAAYFLRISTSDFLYPDIPLKVWGSLRLVRVTARVGSYVA